MRGGDELLLSQCQLDCFGFTGNYLQENSCRPFRMAAFLLPLLYGPNIETESTGKFRLRQSQTEQDCLDIDFFRNMRYGPSGKRRLKPAKSKE